MKLLAMRQRELRQRTTRNGRRGDKSQPKSTKQEGFAPENEEIDSIHFLLEKEISESVTRADLKVQYEERMTEYSEAMRDLVAAVKELEDADNDSSNYQELEHAVQELQLKVELTSASMDKIRKRLDWFEAQDNGSDGKATKNLIKDKSAPVLRTVLLGTLDKLVDSELHRQQLSKTLGLKESVLGGFEKEVDTLNSNIADLKNELAQRHSVIVGSVDPVQAMEMLQKKNMKLANQLEEAEQEKTMLKLFSDDISKEHRDLNTTLAATKEKLTLAEVAIAQSDGVRAPDDVLQKLQSIWNELGVSTSSRESTRLQIENCLEDTCTKKLEEANFLKTETVQQIASIQKDIQSMCVSLDIEDMGVDVSANQTLLQQLEDLQKCLLRLKPIYNSATERRNALLTQLSDVSLSLGISKANLESELKELVEGAGREKKSDTTKPVKLSESFLSQCETSLSELRLQKSRILSGNAKLQKQAFSLVSDMNISESEILSLVVHSIKRRGSTLPDWWNKDCAETVSRTVTTEGGVVRSSKPFSQHLEAFWNALDSISKGRRELSNKLRGVVERAQKTLLSTVDGEFEANEAYSTFHEALFRLPPLSQDFIHACVSEVEALLSGVDAMTQSEIEALTVVWEALNISQASRGKFWGSIDESLREIQSQAVGPFDSVVRASSVDGEEWVLSSVKKATKNYRDLEMRLLRLEKIHEEVERLRKRQDAKSKIISLDSEVRILSSKLNEFEEKKCNKQRLTTKKSTSSNLLKEERFRKQMQAKFTAKLDQLGSLLKSWTSNEKKEFDQSLLSEEVRALLKNSDRNEFMHLRTVEYRGPSTKRGADSIEKGDENGAPPPKRQTTTNRASSSTRASAVRASTRGFTRKQPAPRASSSASSKEEERSTSKKAAAKMDCRPQKRALSPSQTAANLPSRGQHEPKRTKSSRPPLSNAAQPASRSASTAGTTTSSYPSKAGATTRLTLDPFGMVLGEASRAKENPADNDEDTER